MASNDVPEEAPPSYAQATGSSSSSSRPAAGASSNTSTGGSHLNVPGSASSKSGKNGIPAAYRKSMEDEARPLPEGWVRSYDDKTHHQFFVDITKDPPQSQWIHPYDSEEYLATLSTEERERIEQDSMNPRKDQKPSKEDIIAAHSDEDDDHHTAAASSSYAELPPRPDGKGKAADRTFGRKLKDKLTGMTHEERVQDRNQRAEQEQRMYEQHMRVRQAMAQAAQTGQPQYLGKDRDGKDVYIEPPAAPQYGYGGGGYGYGNGYGYSPYRGVGGGPGIYSTPNARYIRPQGPYGRPGGGYGMPLAAGIGGGLLGGALLGGLLF